ncbi:hypothetical protein WJX72_011077 [[Myrmecia] bisecta]|uniref:Deubiquitinating enzyme MINDY-3/4 conserved domain-containing protein n=1 Tax=[Myrmecia] bisecta TaxID=41462 RepID=A0AAW1Q8V6_9CHLO
MRFDSSWPTYCRTLQLACSSTPPEAHQTVALCATVLWQAVRALLPQYMQADGYGLLLLLFSVVLSHSVRQIQAERDEPESALIARHGYCSPDLVNLLLTGRAAANCFNGDWQLDGKVYRGIPARSHLGLLTLLEHCRYVESSEVPAPAHLGGHARVQRVVSSPFKAI